MAPSSALDPPSFPSRLTLTEDRSARDAEQEPKEQKQKEEEEKMDQDQDGRILRRRGRRSWRDLTRCSPAGERVMRSGRLVWFRVPDIVQVYTSGGRDLPKVGRAIQKQYLAIPNRILISQKKI